MPRPFLLAYALLAAGVLLVCASPFLARARTARTYWAIYGVSALAIAAAYATAIASAYGGFLPWSRVAAGTLVGLGAPLLLAGAAVRAMARRRPATGLPALLLVALATSGAAVLLAQPATARLFPDVITTEQ